MDWKKLASAVGMSSGISPGVSLALGLGASLLNKKPKQLPVQNPYAGMAASGLGGALDDYKRQESRWQEESDRWGNRDDAASREYLDFLQRPASDSRDSALVGRAREAIDMQARRSGARSALAPGGAMTSDRVGAQAAGEHRRLAAQANLTAQLTLRNLEKEEARKKAIVDFVASRAARSRAGRLQSQAGQSALLAQLSSLGLQGAGINQQQNAINLQQSGNSLNGILGLISSLSENRGK